MKSLPSKTQHPKKTRHPEILRASGPFLILALTSPVPSVSFLSQLPKSELLQEVLGCLLPVPQHVYSRGNLVSHALVPSCPVSAYSTSCCSHNISALSQLFSPGQDSRNTRICSCSLFFLALVSVFPVGALRVRGRGHRGADSAAP